MSDLKLFRQTGSVVLELEGGAVALERSLQTMIEGNLETFFGVRFLASEFNTTHGGRMDTLGIDENNCPIIIEYKRDLNENVINQGLFYLDWLMDHRRDFEWLVLEKCGKDQAQSVDWSAPRLICIAGDFTKYDEHAVNQMNRNIELIRYKRFGDDLFLLELLTSSTAKQSRVATRTLSSVPDEADYEEETQVEQSLKEASKELLELYESLRSFLISLGDDVQERKLKVYIAFKRIKNFATVNVNSGKQNLYVQLRLSPAEVQLESGFIEDVSEIGTWGTGDVRITINNLADLDRAKPLIQKSYEAT